MELKGFPGLDGMAIFCRATLGGKGSVELHRDLAKQEQSKAEMCNA